jgi:uncharacterized OsmC-like protein
MYTSKVIYQGELRTNASHLKSGNEIFTDAPTDNHGKGEAFSPTDLVATALASCMLTIMGIEADKLGISLVGSNINVTKKMGIGPRRITGIDLEFTIMGDTLNDETKQHLEQAALNCPVAKSIHPEIRLQVSFVYA